MLNDVLKLNEYLKSLRVEYQRDNFDTFLKKIKFNFDVPSIHIAGTNGKGTTGTILNNIYINHGYKVGYYRSPYFKTPLEVISINNKSITLDEFGSIVKQYQKEIKKYDLSSFEVETFVALTWFKNQGCDICVIECGMGGENDATNIFTPILSIITSIGLEHTEYLGSSISEIAFNKAGIIKDNIPCLVGKLDEEALNAIALKASRTNSNVIQMQESLNETYKDNGFEFDFKPYEKLFINSIGLFSIQDACIALSCIDLLKDSFIVDEKDIRKGLKEFHLFGRMNILNNNPLTIVDGAHNPHGISALKDSIEKINVNNKPVHIIFATFKDKNLSSMLTELSFISNDVTLTTFPHERARSKEEYFLYLDEYKFEEDPIKLLKDKIDEFNDDIIVVCGSLAFAYYVLDKLGGNKNE